ncbi:MAG: ATP-dependent Zn protease [Lachnospiraceae bacterium]|nr:ATP-dependent Zn protease [Lachnospiraceae bacterium]
MKKNKKKLIEIHLYTLYTIFINIMRCFIVSCGTAFLIIFFYWDEMAPLKRDVFGKMAGSLFQITLLLLIFSHVLSKVLIGDKCCFGYKRCFDSLGIASEKEEKAISDNRKVCIVHEAGHALMAYLQNVSNFRVTLSKTITTYNTQDVEDVKTMILIDYAGAAAEEILLESFSLGSMSSTDSDFVKATEHIKAYIIMTDSSVSKTMLNEELSQQVISLSKEMYSMSKDLLSENKEMLEVLSNELMKKEEMSKEEIIDLLRD